MKMNVETKSKFSDEKVLFNHFVVKNPDKNLFDLHTHSICEIIYIVSGDVSAVIGGKNYKLYKKSVVIFRHNLMHAIKIDGDADYERFNILFDEKMVANKIFSNIPPEVEIINCDGNNFITDIFKKLDYYYLYFEGDNYKKLVYSLVEELLFNLSIVAVTQKNDISFSVNPLINQAVEYVEKNYKNNITVDEISNALYISKRHLHHLFNTNLNITPKKYINSVRLANAQNFIRMGAKPGDVFYMCGFSDYATFYRNYKEHFGYSPSKETGAGIDKKIIY